MLHFMFAMPRVVFLTSPLAFLLLGQNIIAASPLAIIAYALPHIFHSVATNARLQRQLAAFVLERDLRDRAGAVPGARHDGHAAVSPRRGKFNVTDKGGLLENGYFDLRVRSTRT